MRLAIDRGELQRTLDIDLALDFLAGPLAVRTWVTRQPAGPRYLERPADMIIVALQA